jgi:hypothetical protein
MMRRTPLLLLGCFLALFLLGIVAGEPQRVLEQAWIICLACIGIG